MLNCIACGASYRILNQGEVHYRRSIERIEKPGGHVVLIAQVPTCDCTFEQIREVLLGNRPPAEPNTQVIPINLKAASR